MDATVAVNKLGRIRRIDARDVWKHEAVDFTPWLLENIDQLNEAIGFEIELSGREEAVGPFAVDLYGKEIQTGHPAIIENQLAPTDHTHLGQLLTYAAGLKAGVVVWIAPQFRDEHREALIWLNEISPEDVNFFGIELEILDINGQRAPNFKLVVEPNTWQKARTASIRGRGSAESNQRSQAYQGFFSAYLDGLKARWPGITAASKAPPQSWFLFASGKSGVGFGCSFSTNQRLRVEVYIDTGDRDRNLAIFEALHQNRDEIERDIGTHLEWERLENRQAKRIAAYAPFPVSILSPQETLEQARQWCLDTTVSFVQVFRPRLQALS